MSTDALQHTTVVGRPRKWANPEELQAGIDAYFAECDAKNAPYTMAGLALALDCSRKTLINYETDYSDAQPGFLHAIKRARLRVEAWVEASLWSRCHPAGPIFSLKNNFGWRDEQQVEHTHTLMVGQPGAPVPIPQRLSPVLESAIPLSPVRQIAVSEEIIEAKATPIEGVSPVRVA